jgi:hypothetical protein
MHEKRNIKFSPNVIQVIKSRRKNWALLVASMGEEKCSYTGCWWGKLNEGDGLEEGLVEEK